MFSELAKRRFMDEKHDYRIQAIFNFTSIFEEKSGRDIGQCPESELRELLGRFFSSSFEHRTDLNELCQLFDEYLVWYKEHNPDVPATGSCDLQIWQFFDPEFEIKDEKNFFFSAADLYNIGLTLDARLRYVLYAMYEGIRGDDGKDILTLSIRDVDENNQKVRTSRGEVPVSSKMISVILDAYDSKITLYRQQMHSTNISAIDMEKIIRFRSQPEAMTPAAIKAAMRTLLNSIREACGFPLLTVNNVVMSGFISDIAALYNLSDPNTAVRPALNDPQIIKLAKNYGIALESFAQRTRRAGIIEDFLAAYRDKVIANKSDKKFDDI